jgi:patatin-like phospholipase/acyl hydrolase
MTQYNLLSVDGGGIRGLIPALVLAEIEKRTQQATADLFDIISGTSTGGIIAVGLTVPNPETGRPLFTAKELAGLYLERGKDIFEQSLLQKIGSVRDNAFGHQNLESILQEFFGESELKDALTQVIVTAYDIENRHTFYFNSQRARQDDKENFRVWEVCRSTSAAPTYFEPKQVNYGGELIAVVDGGVFANNPAMLAYIEAKRRFDEQRASQPVITAREASDVAVAARKIEEPFVMLSLGTGSSRKPYPYDKAKDWGLVGWVRPIVDILMQGTSETVHFQMKQLLPPKLNGQNRYYRLDTQLAPEHSDMSDPSEKMLEALSNYAREIIRQHDQQIDELCAQLTA